MCRLVVRHWNGPHHSRQSEVENLNRAVSPDLDVRKKALGIALELVSSKNIDEVLLFLKNELGKTVTVDAQQDKAEEYRQILIQTISQCAIQYPAASEGVVDTLIAFVADTDHKNAGAPYKSVEPEVGELR